MNEKKSRYVCFTTYGYNNGCETIFYSYNVYGSCHAYLSLARILCIYIKVFPNPANLPVDFQPVPCAPLENIILANQATIDLKCAKETLTVERPEDKYRKENQIDSNHSTTYNDFKLTFFSISIYDISLSGHRGL